MSFWSSYHFHSWILSCEVDFKQVKKKWLVTPIIFMPASQQWAYSGMPIIIIFHRVYGMVKTWWLFSPGSMNQNFEHYESYQGWNFHISISLMFSCPIIHIHSIFSNSLSSTDLWEFHEQRKYNIWVSISSQDLKSQKK